MKKLNFLIIFLSLLFSFQIEAKMPRFASPHVSILDEVYEDIDVLIAHELAHPEMMGHRPWTRRQIAKILVQAQENLSQKNLDEKTLSYLEDMIHKYHREYIYEINRLEGKVKKNDIHVEWLDEVEIKVTGLDSPSRPHFNYGSSQLDAQYLSLVQNQEGRHFQDGFQHAWETYHRAQLGSHLAINFEPRIQIQTAVYPLEEDSKIFINNLYASVYALNHRVDAGRKLLHWGQGKHGGMLFSNNARALDGVQFTNEDPWDLPLLGDFKYSFFFADLGPEQRFSGTNLVGLKFTIQPADWLELGLARSITYGGDNAPVINFNDTLGEVFGTSAFSSGNNPTNSITGFEFRFRFPFLRGTEFYGEAYLDDFTKSKIYRSLRWDSALLAGIYIPRLDKKGSLSLRAEYKLTNNPSYRHTPFRSGWTLNDYILGDPLGPEALGGFISIKKRFSDRFSMWYDIALERSDSNIHVTINDDLEIVTDQIAEKRFRQILGASYRWTKLLKTTHHIGYERVENFNYDDARNLDNFLFRLDFNFNIDAI